MAVTPTDGADAKSVKLSTIHELLQNQFPSAEISIVEASKVVKDAFPHAVHKRST